MLLISLDDRNGSTKNSYITFTEHYKQHSLTVTYVLMEGNLNAYCGGGTDTTIKIYLNGTAGYSIALWGIY